VFDECERLNGAIKLRVEEEFMAAGSTAIPYAAENTSAAKGVVVLLGRLFFATIFLLAGPNHFTKQSIGYAASQGVPLASIAVPISGLLAIAGGLSILLGYRAKIGGWLIVLFLVPVTFMMHKFWTVSDSMMAQIQMIMFIKNFAMLGGALLITQFGAGPLSLDARRSR
jgi:putative oxidoreductase